MRTLAEDSVLRETMGQHNARAAEEFALDTVMEQMKVIYEGALAEPAPADAFVNEP